MKFSEDTSTLLSPAHIDEFTLPSLKRVLDSTGGGYVHFCGYNAHLLEICLHTENVRGVNFGDPGMYDMEDVLRRLAKAGKVYYGAIPQKPDEDLSSYFSRLCKAATDSSGCCRLLLVMNAANQNEDLKSYFLRLCKAATDSSGCCRLLLVMNAANQEEAQIIKAAWESVNPLS